MSMLSIFFLTKTFVQKDMKEQPQTRCSSITEQFKLQPMVFQRVTRLVEVDLARFTRYYYSCVFFMKFVLAHLNNEDDADENRRVRFQMGLQLR